MATYALIVAAGSSTRFGGPVPKQYRDLAGRSVLYRSAKAFVEHPAVAGVKVVIRAEDEARYRAAVAGLDLLEPVGGGETRQDSVRLGLESLCDRRPDGVLIHDGARPLVVPALIDRVVTALAAHPGAIPALAVADTLKRGRDGLIAGTVPREGLHRAQTPQGFRFDDILAAHRAAAGQSLTDDAAVAEAHGLAVALVDGGEDNLKITTEDDLRRAERLVWSRLPETRVGQGYDVHRLGPGGPITLCGVAIPHDRALIGHSDADVGLHALTDALLGALGQGDLGQHFPPTDARWKGAPSATFLRHAGELVARAGGLIAHLDVTLICERPKIAPHRQAMRAAIAATLGIALERVSVKATTTEGLGLTGRGEGIAAQAVATIRLPPAGDAR
ncbi:MAG: bifunctional 2-C-methyl-D-erythritol 4-phosphate cytidylyltransferase/2-C-methyl-D-erythritol 2,4-cyclodiphosphate synthase [Alphaproteobacteria bacterium]|nr:bifunctional 2-C-methyl-D-erythritol 4-phosphate cytidylyltransferase/2-C-methyl-D-erythritol 2,4-cyclodiphosphate synthase [Alphaproteobacteria bacterium]